MNTPASDLQKVETEVGFVRANWGKLSAVIIITLAIGVAIGRFVL